MQLPFLPLVQLLLCPLREEAGGGAREATGEGGETAGGEKAGDVLFDVMEG